PLGAERLRLAPVVGEHVPHARDRKREQAPARVDALAEPRDPQPADDLVHAAVLHVRDEKPRRVGAEVDRGDAGHFRGRNARTPSAALLTSWTARRSTRARASVRFSCATLRWSSAARSPSAVARASRAAPRAATAPRSATTPARS